MSQVRSSITVPVLVIIVGILASMFGVVGTASAAHNFQVEIDGVVSGGGSAGTGSLAAAAIFSVSDSSGGGAFSGTVGGVQASGLFQVNSGIFVSSSTVPCPMGQVSAGGNVTSGSFSGEQVLVASCIGSGVAASIIFHNDAGEVFSGQGTGTAAVSRGSGTVSTFVATGVTSGSGSAGSGTIYTAEADGTTEDDTLVGGGAFTGTVSDHPTQQGNTWGIHAVSFQSGCTLIASGVTASFGSFPNQPVSSTYTPVTCPPTSLGPQTARFVYVVGGEVSPIYKGAGSAAFKFVTAVAQ